MSTMRERPQGKPPILRPQRRNKTVAANFLSEAVKLSEKRKFRKYAGEPRITQLKHEIKLVQSRKRKNGLRLYKHLLKEVTALNSGTQ